MLDTASYGSVNVDTKVASAPSKNPREFLIETNAHEFAAIVTGGTLLAYNAGFINVVSLLISDILVSHTTGNISKSSVMFAEGDWLKFVEVTIMLPCFILGSFVTTMMIHDSTFRITKRYYRVFLVGTVLLGLAAVVGILTDDSQLYAYVATIACGMQNALTTKYSGSIIRTTHTTGMATDIGICLGRIAKGRPNELWKLQVQLPLLMGFFLGGVCGCLAHKVYKKHAMFFPVLTFGGIGLLYVGVVAYQRGESYLQALLGNRNEPHFQSRGGAGGGVRPLFTSVCNSKSTSPLPSGSEVTTEHSALLPV